MVATRACLLFFSLFVLQNVNSTQHRFIRSPDTVDVIIPNYSTEDGINSSEHQDNMNEEAEYWQGEGDQGQNQFNQSVQNGEKYREESENGFEKEQQHEQDQQETINAEVQEGLHKDRETAETYQEDNMNHYHAYNDTIQNIGDQADDEAQREIEKAEIYEEKVTEYAKDKEEGVVNNNHGIEGITPSYTYNQD